MEITATDEGQATVLAVVGDMDSAHAYDVYLAAVGAAEQGATTVVIDVAGVEFIDSVGLGMLVRSRDELANMDARLYLRSVSGRAARLLAVTGLTDTFDIDEGTPTGS